ITSTGDFVYPSPAGNDAAWLFGGRMETGEGVESQAVRVGAFVRTASGFAVGDLSPCMIWSRDSRYLALAQLADMDSEPGCREWRLLLLDTEVGMLHAATDILKGAPYFQRLDA